MLYVPMFSSNNAAGSRVKGESSARQVGMVKGPERRREKEIGGQGN